MKKRTAVKTTIAFCIFGVLFVSLSPLAVYLTTRGNFSTSLHADYLDGLGEIAIWAGEHDLEEEWREESRRIRDGLAKVSLDFNSKSEASLLVDEAFKILPDDIHRFGSTTNMRGKGEVRFEIPKEEKEAFERGLKEFHDLYRKKQAQQ